jgi:hypothetical protein
MRFLVALERSLKSAQRPAVIRKPADMSDWYSIVENAVVAAAAVAEPVGSSDSMIPSPYARAVAALDVSSPAAARTCEPYRKRPAVAHSRW